MGEGTSLEKVRWSDSKQIFTIECKVDYLVAESLQITCGITSLL